MTTSSLEGGGVEAGIDASERGIGGMGDERSPSASPHRADGVVDGAPVAVVVAGAASIKVATGGGPVATGGGVEDGAGAKLGGAGEGASPLGASARGDEGGDGGGEGGSSLALAATVRGAF